MHAALVVRPCTYCRAAELVWNDAYIENQSRILYRVPGDTTNSRVSVETSAAASH